MVSAGGTPSGEHSLGEGEFLTAGTMVGEYRIVTKLSEGGMGEVYAGIHPLIEKRVAIKVIRRALGFDKVALERFVQEARAVNQIVDSVPYLRKLPWVGKRKVAVLGFCMGGGLALYALAQSKAFDAGVIYYQSMFPDPEDLKTISAPLLCHYGTDDHGTTQTEIDMFRDSLERHKKKFQIEMYPGAGHAFLNNPSSKSAANREAAAKSVASTGKWLKKVLA